MTADGFWIISPRFSILKKKEFLIIFKMILPVFVNESQACSISNQSLATQLLSILIVAPCILIYVEFTHQLMHFY